MQVAVEVLKAHSKGGKMREVGSKYMAHIKKAKLLAKLGRVKILAKAKEAGTQVEKKQEVKPQLDLKNAPFNPEIHQPDKENPFYKKGPRAGQWRKQSGVSDEDYDGYHAQFIRPTDGDFHTTEMKVE